jgi:HlyD family secretion protein
MGRHGFRLFVLLLIIVLAGGLVWYKMRPQELEVSVAKVTRGTVEKVVANTRAGTLNACREANLSPGTGGQISLLTVEEGDSVKKGQLLLELWNDDLKAEEVLAKSQVKAARGKAYVALMQAEIRPANPASGLSELSLSVPGSLHPLTGLWQRSTAN